MSGPIVFISRNRIVDGRRAEFELAYPRALDSSRRPNQKTALFAAYVDNSGTEVRVVHAFPDADAMALHFEGSQDRAQSASASDHSGRVRDLRASSDNGHRAATSQSATIDAGVHVFGDALGGFLRAAR